MRMRFRFVAAVFAAALVTAPIAAAATPSAVFGLRAVGNPKLGYFVYDLGAGATRSGAVIVSNTGTRAGVAKLYAVDAGTGSTTGTVYLTDRKPVRAGTWVTLAKSRVTIAPGKFVRVPFTVHVPAGTAPGQWVAGLVAEAAVQTESGHTNSKTGVQIKIRNQTIVAVQVNVPGARRAAFAIGAVKTGGQRGFQQVLVHLTNTGNVLSKPTGAVEILQAGRVVEKLPFKMDSFLPQTSIDYPVLLTKALPAGDYRARVSLSYPSASGGTQTIHGTPAFSVSKQDVKQVFTSAAPTQQAPGGTVASSSSSTPWAVIGAIIAALILLALVGWALLRRRSSSGSRAPGAGDPASCTPFHYWDVDYDHGVQDDDGTWRFPHRCRNCRLEVTAKDITDASAQADARSGE
jgi:hypothetical protein